MGLLEQADQSVGREELTGRICGQLEVVQVVHQLLLAPRI